MIKTVRLTNIMSHVNTLYEFPKTGIVNICGENSNGKSVLTKAFDYTLVKKCLHMLKKRDVLIRHGCSYGEVEYSFYSTDDTLLVHIDREACNTYYQSSKDNVKIYITGQHELIERLVAEFGISQLNVYKHLQPLLFVTTSATDNYNILSECVRDINVENAVKNLENQLENLEGSYKELKTSILVTAKQLEMLPEYDVEKENKFIDKASDIINLLRIVSAIPIIAELKLYKVLPDVNIVDIRLPKIQAIKIPKEIPEYSTFPEIPKISPLSISWYKELESVRNSVCPVCGRRLL